MNKELQKYKSGDLEISYDPNICTHAANCVNGHPEIFNIDNKPWVSLDKATKESITDAVNKCPSGALKMGDESKISGKEGIKTQIDIISKGPFLIKGKFEIKDQNGNVLETKEKAALCRCGASSNKPFCDGTHNKIDFDN